MWRNKAYLTAETTFTYDILEKHVYLCMIEQTLKQKFQNKFIVETLMISSECIWMLLVSHKLDRSFEKLSDEKKQFAMHFLDDGA